MKASTLGLTLLMAIGIAPAAAAQDRPADAPLVRMRDGHGSDLLFRVHPRTLRPLSRPIRTFRSGSDMALTSDGRLMAYTGGWRAGSTIHFVDLARWRSLGIARLGRRGPLGVGWVGPNRVVAITGEGFGRQRLLLVDVRSRKVVARRAFTGRRIDALPVPGGFALALAPKDGVGPLRLLIADAAGGTQREDRRRSGGRERARAPTPVPGNRPSRWITRVAASSWSRPAGCSWPRSSSRRARSRITRSARAPRRGTSTCGGARPPGWGTGALRCPASTSPTRGQRLPPGPVPFGVRLIDTSAWSITTLDPRPSVMHVAGDTVLAYGTRWFDGYRRSESTGLLAFDGTGRRAFARFRGQQIATLGSRGRLIYAWVRRTRTLHVIDVRDGRTLNEVHTSRRIPFLLTPRS